MVRVRRSLFAIFQVGAFGIALLLYYFFSVHLTLAEQFVDSRTGSRVAVFVRGQELLRNVFPAIGNSTAWLERVVEIQDAKQRRLVSYSLGFGEPDARPAEVEWLTGAVAIIDHFDMGTNLRVFDLEKRRELGQHEPGFLAALSRLDGRYHFTNIWQRQVGAGWR